MSIVSVLNAMICFLLVVLVLQAVFLAHQQVDEESRKQEMKHQLNFYLDQLRGKLHEMNASVSELYKQSHLRVSSRKTPSNNEKQLGSAEAAYSDVIIPKPKGEKNILKNHYTHEYSQRVIGKKKALLFTMDSITSYEANSKRGGAAGELLIRHSLEHAFSTLGVDLDVMVSDEEFLRAKSDIYDFIIVDPWTWAAKGWVPKPLLRNHVNKVYVLDFFGSEKLPKEKPSFRIPPERFLTAFGYPGNQFLGYYIDKSIFDKYKYSRKKQQGVIWGKDPKHFGRMNMMLSQVADMVELHSTATMSVFRHRNVVWHGHQTKESWLQLLAESKFLIGLGDPLLGPSAIDAISMGCVYINPIYDSPVRNHFRTQHDYADVKIGSPYVCNVHLNDIKSVRKCVEFALKSNLPPFIPPDFEHDTYIARVKTAFSL